VKHVFFAFLFAKNIFLNKSGLRTRPENRLLVSKTQIGSRTDPRTRISG